MRMKVTALFIVRFWQLITNCPAEAPHAPVTLVVMANLEHLAILAAPDLPKRSRKARILESTLTL